MRCSNETMKKVRSRTIGPPSTPEKRSYLRSGFSASARFVKMGVADPNKLGVGGWSYGGILTDYVIASDNRFKAATSGAGTAFTVAFYGTDQYIIQYDYEIGPPWNPKSWEIYQKLSYPFLHADRIKTPTLFLGGERDFNVPVQGGQQMYQALRSLGVETQLRSRRDLEARRVDDARRAADPLRLVPRARVREHGVWRKHAG